MEDVGTLTATADVDTGFMTIPFRTQAMAFQKKLKKMFTRLFTTKSKGQRLGLTVVKRLKEALSDTIDFYSKPLKGLKSFWSSQKTKPHNSFSF